MQEIILICFVSAGASLMTFFAGFGLGTLLMPAFALFFPIDVSVALTGVVHFLNNVFKLNLVKKHIDISILWKFGLPATVAAFLGAWVLGFFSVDHILYQSHLFGTHRNVVTIKFVIGALMLFFVLLELIPTFKDKTFPPQLMWLGGLLSGFFGGLAGFQGVLRSMFLLKSGLSKEGYIATGIAIACLIDMTRLGIYVRSDMRSVLINEWPLLACATIAAFLGAYLGNLWLSKTTYKSIQAIVSVLLIMFSMGLLFGVL